ncbi:GSCFA family protein [Rhodobacteraceae bacterium 2CG4]|uniref:GSCFA family protein n=1 Tax=Halovulum marinum TaxID=2662447 RepID=A0A6L5YVX4_9RHOB|nr:GSCFA domain-containing protein [Halovulum marinum]MSU88377.1 GSCFA family protein [Halovulum marinum]
MDRPASPYRDLPPRAYWRSAVAERAPLDPGDLYRPRFPVTRDMRIVTAGSCFAQHVGRALRTSGFNVMDFEPLPARVRDETARRYGYRLFSARYGNIYTARQLAQLQAEADGALSPALPVWRKGDRFVDAQRPGVEPDGLESEALVLRHREAHLTCVRKAFRSADLFVFTFGLTEAWCHRDSGTVYPTAPGTIAGSFDPQQFAFRNFDVPAVLADFCTFRETLRQSRPDARFLVTVSPVPLTATATGQHVEVASCYSKSVLRAVCGMLTERFEDVDYFPSFEIITSQNARGAYYEANLRNVAPQGVETAMGAFRAAHGIGDAPEPEPDEPRRQRRRRREDRTEDVVCEEVLLEAFSR